ncbi:hypothetical protein C9I56_00240 [Paraburkholderia caribensis]|uniref:Uncharacterized protein n=1 Tax=Paraburkholderia caribensis TaxID=75105 RepID=A0A9Q6S6W8_9BURK|nr:hypothetical protein C9I56_00240 [Paraburkholderia caribensis]QLB65588.1 hypothetical protein A9O66_24760 [Paraburkholderia caribensis]
MPTADSDRLNHASGHATYSKQLDLGQLRLTKLDEGKSGIANLRFIKLWTEVSKARQGRRRMVASAAAKAGLCAYLVRQVPE